MARFLCFSDYVDNDIENNYGLSLDTNIDDDINSNKADVNHDDGVNNNNGGMDLVGASSKNSKCSEFSVIIGFIRYIKWGPTHRGIRYLV